MLAQAYESPNESGNRDVTAEDKSENSVTASNRLAWVAKSTFGPLAILTTTVESAIQTGTNTPPEYGTHWDGYGKRLASKFGTSALSNSVEAGLGALWGEDPRYHRLGAGPKRERIWHAVKMSVLAENAVGDTMPAYARYIAIPTTRVISDEWRPPSQTTVPATVDRITLAFVRKIAGNAFNEFWPDIRKHVRLLRQ
jgi:hypothetical protein